MRKALSSFAQGLSHLFVLFCTFSREENSDSLKDNLKIKTNAPIIDIFTVETYDLFKISDIASAGYLPQTGYTGLDAQSPLMIAAVLLVLINGRRPCSYKAHIAFEYVDKLWEFIDAGLSDEFADFCDTGIIRHLKHETIHLVLFHEFGLPGFRILVHASEFIHLEDSSVLAYTILLEEHGTGRLDHNGNPDEDHQNQCDDASDDTTDDINNSFLNLMANARLFRSEAEKGNAG